MGNFCSNCKRISKDDKTELSGYPLIPRLSNGIVEQLKQNNTLPETECDIFPNHNHTSSNIPALKSSIPTPMVDI